jgi:hypothetical protein
MCLFMFRVTYKRQMERREALAAVLVAFARVSSFWDLFLPLIACLYALCQCDHDRVVFAVGATGLKPNLYEVVVVIPTVQATMP